MEYLDFSSVITTIRNYISDAHSMNQIDMMYQLFVSFLSSDAVSYTHLTLPTIA